ncbi:YciI family protein [Herbiconiux moechotypicola]|nr:YciI family protein [Herbiconiux moechotypicola]MCS5729411.1 YciI family protein [Herbiconiux moechotypicola]
MQYLLTIIVDETIPTPHPGQPGFAEMVEGWAAYNHALHAAGVLVDASQLAPSLAATTVRLAVGTPAAVTDGPFTEAKEQLAGYYRIRAANLDDALEWAKRMPMPFGSVEVRPIVVAPGPDGTPTPVTD